MALANYSPAIFNALPDLGDSGREFDARNGNSLVEKIGDLFVKHNMEYIFGLSLLHRHFDIGEEERMVEYRGTSSPWSACLSMTSPAIRAINWAVADDGTFRPFEFEYSPDDRDSIEPCNPENAKFADAFKALLHDEHAAGLFGICAHPGLGFKGRVEITEGRTNINLAPEHVRCRLQCTVISYLQALTVLSRLQIS